MANPACRLLRQCAEVLDMVRRILEIVLDNPCLRVMFAYMVVASKIPDPLLEIGALSDVGQPLASYSSELDEDSRASGRAWLCGVVGVDPRLVLWSIP